MLGFFVTLLTRSEIDFYEFMCYVPVLAWICMNVVGYWTFHVKISTLSQIWGQHTEAAWNSACTHVLSFFLASRIEIRKWILRLQVQRVSFAKLWHVRVFGTPGIRGTPEQRAIVSIDIWRPQWAARGAMHAWYIQNTHISQFGHTSITDRLH